MAYLRQVRCKSSFHRQGYHQWDRTHVSDFEPAGDKVSVDNPAQFFRDHGRDFYVCCADMEANTLVLAKSEDISKTRKAPFFGEALRLDAETLLVIPFSLLPGVAAEVAKDVKHITTTFLFQTTRCGSTLLTKALQASGVIHTISESDVYTSFCQYVVTKKKLDEDDMAKLMGVICHTNTLFNFTLWQGNPSQTVVCFKMRGQVTSIADLLCKAVPGAKTILLYRGLTGTVDSYARMITGGSYWKYWLLTALKLDHAESRKIAVMAASSPWENPMFASLPVPHGIVWFTACVWLELMQKAVAMTDHGSTQRFHVVLRYEELMVYKEAMVMKVMDCLGIRFSDKDTGREDTRSFWSQQSGGAYGR
ncbi:uncharacterized protein [Branchiostoma lanceolatum]|uniref:uncharacterized protein n=1 Tax=Branchiostoma lanceolatum TaxID=7740 RepID=UPI0034545A09